MVYTRLICPVHTMFNVMYDIKQLADAKDPANGREHLVPGLEAKLTVSVDELHSRVMSFATRLLKADEPEYFKIK